MFERLKYEAIKRGAQLMGSPTVARLMADPRVLTALEQGGALKDALQGRLDGRITNVAEKLNLVTRTDLANLEKSLRRMASTIDDLEGKMADEEDGEDLPRA